MNLRRGDYVFVPEFAGPGWVQQVAFCPHSNQHLVAVSTYRRWSTGKRPGFRGIYGVAPLDVRLIKRVVK